MREGHRLTRSPYKKKVKSGLFAANLEKKKFVWDEKKSQISTKVDFWDFQFWDFFLYGGQRGSAGQGVNQAEGVNAVPPCMCTELNTTTCLSNCIRHTHCTYHYRPPTAAGYTLTVHCVTSSYGFERLSITTSRQLLWYPYRHIIRGGIHSNFWFNCLWSDS